MNRRQGQMRFVFTTAAERLAKDKALFLRIAATVVVDPPVAGMKNG